MLIGSLPSFLGKYNLIIEIERPTYKWQFYAKCMRIQDHAK